MARTPKVEGQGQLSALSLVTARRQRLAREKKRIKGTAGPGRDAQARDRLAVADKIKRNDPLNKLDKSVLNADDKKKKASDTPEKKKKKEKKPGGLRGFLKGALGSIGNKE